MFRQSSIYDAGEYYFSRAASLRLTASEAHVDLIEELDSALTIRWAGQGSRAVDGHWSNSDRVQHQWHREKHRKFHGNVLSMAVMWGVYWYLDTKLRSQSLSTKKRPGLPLLAYALNFDEWAFSKYRDIPDTMMIAELLRYGAHPNELYEGFTIWQYTINYVHEISDFSHRVERIPLLLQVFKIMLQYGADPEACCIEEGHFCPDTVQRELRMGPGLAGLPLHKVHDVHQKLQYPCSHSVTALVNDIFWITSDDGSEKIESEGLNELKALLEEKKKAVRPSQMKRKVKGGGGNGRSMRKRSA